MEQSLSPTLVFASIVLLWILAIFIRPRNSVPLPPSPPADPIIGHLRMMPTDDQGTFFYELSKKYGKVVYLWLPGRTMIIINSAQAAVDLLDKRSALYSDRPPSDVFMLMGWEETIAFFPYGERLRKHRKMINDYLRREKCKDYLPAQALEACKLVENLASTPEKFLDHLSRFSAAIIIRIIYGHEVVSDNDYYVKIVTETAHCVTKCAPPGSNIVDLLPIMKYLPSWCPGTYPATQARSYRPTVDLMHTYPFEDVKMKTANGTANDSFLRSHVEGLQNQGSAYPYPAKDIKGAAAAITNAGTDTTHATLMAFMLTMVLYPSIQARAQEELDNWLDSGRLPDFDDRPHLPYLECLLQETYRWHSVTPTGIPHKSTEDDIYNGMFIPKGSIIVANTRGITLDEDVYKDPLAFDPSRYQRGEPHPIGHFGFGRRICPGRFLADSSVWIAMATILAIFNISPPAAPNGTPIMPVVEFGSGLSRLVFFTSFLALLETGTENTFN